MELKAMSSSSSFKSKLSRKVKKYASTLFKETGIVEVQSSKYAMVCNAGLVSGIKRETIVDVFSKYHIQQIIMIPRKSYCFVEFNDENEATRAFENVHGKLILPEVKGPLYLLRVEKLPITLAKNACQRPDGLFVFPEFINHEEEQFLINFVNAELNSSEMVGNCLKHRVVKHYGYVFDYKTNNVDKISSTCPSIPEELNFLLEKLENCGDMLRNWFPDQLTINVYQPGQGIPPHVDTHSAFDGVILSLSLNSDIVMDFKSIEGNLFSYPLPRRSLLLMTNESRYGWTHGIVPRKYDTIECSNGLTTKKRDTRISFTFRKTLDKHVCSCSYGALCDSQNFAKNSSSHYIDNEIASELERIHVHEVYDKIADHFSETRHKPWPNVNAFVKSFDAGSMMIDIGCGNGKYLGLNANIFQLGCDRNEKFVSECHQKCYEALMCDCLHLPFRSDVVDCCLSIAVIHHLSTEERRVAAIKEIARVLKPEGKSLIYVWAKDQRHKETASNYLRQKSRNKHHINDIDSENISHSIQLQKTLDNRISLPVHVNRTQFKHEDMFVPWKMKPENSNSEDTTVFLRYYHVFDEGELEKLCNSIENIKIIKSYYDQGNWCIIIQKNS